MYLRKFLSVMIALPFVIISCSKNLPTTPEDAYRAVKLAYEKKDARRMMSLFTAGTVAAYNATAHTLSAMDPKQKESLFTKGAIPGKGILTAEDLIRHELAQTQAAQDNPLYTALSKPILSISEQNGKASVRTADGVELRFVKEGSYWKFTPEGK